MADLIAINKADGELKSAEIRNESIKMLRFLILNPGRETI